MCSYENRVRALLKKALESPLATVTAGPGYGKTRAVEDYIKSEGVNAVWVRLSGLESTPARFWNSFIKATAEPLWGLSVTLEKIGFPYSDSEVYEFIKIMRAEMATQSFVSAPFLFVFDDFGHVASGSVGRLMETILESRIEACRFVLVCSSKTGFEATGLRTGGFYPLTSADLRFTEEETAEYFLKKGHTLSKAKLRKLWEYTEGWPLALRAFADSETMLSGTLSGSACRVLSYPGGKHLEDSGMALRFDIINSIFEKEYFKNYSSNVRDALVKLSLLPGFVLDALKNAQIANIRQAVDAVRSNLFIEYNHADRIYTMHNMYRDFLSGWQCVLQEDEKLAFLEDAGDAFRGRSLLPEGIECFEKCGNFDKMLAAIKEHDGVRIGAVLEDSGYISEKLRGFPDDFKEKHPIIEYLQAVVFFNTNEMERCQNLLRAFIDKLRYREMPATCDLLGKAYYLMGSISMFCCRQDFLNCYIKAAKYLQGKAMATSQYPHALHVGNRGVMGMDGRKAGALERMKAAMDEVMPYYKQVTGGGEGLNLLFNAEAAYHTLKLDEARAQARAAIKEADEHEQYDISCNARLLLGRIALMKGDSGELLRQLASFSDYVDNVGNPVLERLRDSGISWLYLCMDMPEAVATHLKKLLPESCDKLFVAYGRDNIIRAFHMLVMEEYDDLLVHLDKMENYYARWLDKLNIHILRAITLMKSGGAGAMESLWLACDMAMENGVAAPFIERGYAMHMLAEKAKSQQGFDRDWLNCVSKKSLAYAKRLNCVRKEFRARHGINRDEGVKLTKRETEVLRSLSQGMTRDEIAQANFVSVNTVKGVIRSIYIKLGAVNRADAVRISTILGLL